MTPKETNKTSIIYSIGEMEIYELSDKILRMILLKKINEPQ